MPVKASELVAMLCDHIKEYGDGYVMIYDDYLAIYKTLRKREISRMTENRFVIECKDDSDN
jgi:hypothetical protein